MNCRTLVSGETELNLAPFYMAGAAAELVYLAASKSEEFEFRRLKKAHANVFMNEFEYSTGWHSDIHGVFQTLKSSVCTNFEYNLCNISTLISVDDLVGGFYGRLPEYYAEGECDFYDDQRGLRCWPAVEAVANALLEKMRLTGADVLQLSETDAPNSDAVLAAADAVQAHLKAIICC